MLCLGRTYRATYRGCSQCEDEKVVVLELRWNYSVPGPCSRSVVGGAMGARGISFLGGAIEVDRIRYQKGEERRVQRNHSTYSSK
jgi:hypothetical protein